MNAVQCNRKKCDATAMKAFVFTGIEPVLSGVESVRGQNHYNECIALGKLSHNHSILPIESDRQKCFVRWFDSLLLLQQQLQIVWARVRSWW
mmetsp:Transcript_25397/g.59841  ORF Transcript_25397/g.59841 Transcript_25397/m.59841 type:complete len:92 (+) Transcript_25397:73-348(+)